MPRKKRIHINNTIYHVMSRGNHKMDIFLDDMDKRVFCNYMRDGLSRYGHAVLAFCLMGNHFHLALKVNKKPLQLIMHQLLSRYSKYFNAKYHLVGHCFQGRYTCKCVFDENYLFDLCKYIHLNPVRACIVENINDYYWSSHATYLDHSRFRWVDTNFLLSRIDACIKCAREKYLTFIHNESDYPKEILFRFNTPDDTRPTSHNTTALDINTLIRQVAKAYCVTPQQLTDKSRCHRRSEARAVVGYLAVNLQICSLTTVATAFHRSQPSISQAVSRLERRLRQEPNLLNSILNN